MAHVAQQQFCQEVKQRFPDFFSGSRVLEIGSRNINGTLRDEFADGELGGGEYVGVDCQAGDGVDVVCLGHEYDAPDGSFDVVLAAETFEHDPHAEQTVANMLRLLRSGGLFFMTCGGEGRREHGTTRTGKRYGPDANYYGNVTMGQFLAWSGADRATFREIYLRHNAETCDLYFFGIKA